MKTRLETIEDLLNLNDLPPGSDLPIRLRVTLASELGESETLDAALDSIAVDEAGNCIIFHGRADGNQ